ncbi:hypothetical protein A3G55_02795 [Candidatus Giovannonibacteria bacterium RIFCSPLOWO2_12_FULL_44_25]|uniref:Uncharacterized protein n=4 Tax=Parcubacteria group TaxID=1794811 RepID=A0A837IJC1_9BACT|nr:MAG: hypothetical protein UW15_C0014G0023 [Parcubacteria group bacterium GW2011_GWC1_44_10]KKT57079.1 MAG: hypothetical protein UW49_C0008G0041 [Candidatus Giovannonibacteria bacterium GW2011_GWB1_44_23]KKT59516.1 MAG: hypothetical protein UW53_C0011G0045 [Candidatus Giovannonibacteria bacterium GW2011_GWA1_44_25]KKU13050.1 MAG: hypothetical protein UX18_C0003G0018 [Candidatus Azambacteria bacterium GW2011_GWC2_45_7b]OGF49963.1 MAG: hypothetical protein A2120_04620 [Candidatus Giovannonibact
MKKLAFVVSVLLLTAVFTAPLSASAAESPKIKPGSFLYGFVTTFEKVNLFFTFNIWIILGIVSIILLAVYFRRGRNALWGGLTAGVIIGFIIALFSGFNWYIVGKGAISGTMVGFVTELLGTLSDYLKKRT